MDKIKKKKKKEERFIPKNITITPMQEEWIEKNCLNLSRFVQSKLEEVMTK